MIIKKINEKTDFEILKNLVEIHKRCILETNSKDYSKEIIEEWVSTISIKNIQEQIKNSIWIILKEEDEVLGFTQYSIKDKKIYQIQVIPDRHGEGIGKRLYRYIEDEFRREKIEDIKLYSTLNALEFYKLMGFKKGKKNLITLKNETLYLTEMKKGDEYIYAFGFGEFLGIDKKDIKPNPKEDTGQFDYIVGKYAVEISKIIDEDEYTLWGTWLKSQKCLKEALNIPTNKKKYKSVFEIRIDMNIRLVNKYEVDNCVKQILHQIDNDNLEFILTTNNGEYKVSVYKESIDGESAFNILGSCHRTVKNVLEEQIASKIIVANKQLSFYCKRNRVLLFIDKWKRSNECRRQESFLNLEKTIKEKYKNIDEIWVLCEERYQCYYKKDSITL